MATLAQRTAVGRALCTCASDCSYSCHACGQCTTNFDDNLVLCMNEEFHHLEGIGPFICPYCRIAVYVDNKMEIKDHELKKWLGSQLAHPEDDMNVDILRYRATDTLVRAVSRDDNVIIWY